MRLHVQQAVGTHRVQYALQAMAIGSQQEEFLPEARG